MVDVSAVFLGADGFLTRLEQEVLYRDGFADTYRNNNVAGATFRSAAAFPSFVPDAVDVGLSAEEGIAFVSVSSNGVTDENAVRIYSLSDYETVSALFVDMATGVKDISGLDIVPEDMVAGIAQLKQDM
ncbi:hypothetical protein N9Z27_00555 [Alphaproteobacteria bacterium]|nr:hypothetical protein [Alphaproteobacteria bacterium]